MKVALFHIRRERPWAPGFQRELDDLNRGACEAVRSLGWTPVLIPSAEIARGESVAAAHDADAVVLMGGEDVSPELYGGLPVYPGAGRCEPHADAAHIAVALSCRDSRTPLLGICRGHQILNVAFGGTLIQHLPTVQNHRGHGNGDTAFVDAQVTVGEELLIDVDPGEAVMCSHHQAIDRLGAGLRATAHAPDGVIEAVAHESAPITGVQWHPEHPRVAMAQLVPLLRRLERSRVRDLQVF